MQQTRIQLLRKVIADSKSLDQEIAPLAEHPDLREIRIHRASEKAIQNLEVARVNARTLIVRS